MLTTGPTSTELSEWCRRRLGSPADQVLFEAGFASRVVGLRLADGREVVLKVRTHSPRMRAAAMVQRHLWEAGFPCPQPLAGPVALGEHWISAEALISGGAPLTDDPEAPELYAAALAELIRLAPSPDTLPSLSPPPDHAHWNHTEKGLWPRRDALDEAIATDLNQEPDPVWLGETARRVRARLASCTSPDVVGHADWWSQNLRWIDRRLHVVHDWDSVTAQPEALLAGEAAYMFASTDFELDGCAPGATIEATKRFLLAYEEARRRPWTAEEREVAWAAGLWVAAFRARLSRFEDRGEGFADLVRAEAPERLRRAGA
jgi:hypothetical protein